MEYTKEQLKKPKTLNWDVSTVDYLLISQIASRALRLLADLPTMQGVGRDHQFTEICLDLTAVHCNGCPLNLSYFLGMDDTQFIHDLAGIRCHLDRRTGQLSDHFVPRCAREETY